MNKACCIIIICRDEPVKVKLKVYVPSCFFAVLFPIVGELFTGNVLFSINRQWIFTGRVIDTVGTTTNRGAASISDPIVGTIMLGIGKYYTEERFFPVDWNAHQLKYASKLLSGYGTRRKTFEDGNYSLDLCLHFMRGIWSTVGKVESRQLTWKCASQRVWTGKSPKIGYCGDRRWLCFIFVGGSVPRSADASAGDVAVIVIDDVDAIVCYFRNFHVFLTLPTTMIMCVD